MITKLLRCNTIGIGGASFGKYVYNKTILTVSIAVNIDMEQPGSRFIEHGSKKSAISENKAT